MSENTRDWTTHLLGKLKSVDSADKALAEQLAKLLPYIWESRDLLMAWGQEGVRDALVAWRDTGVEAAFVVVAEQLSIPDKHRMLLDNVRKFAVLYNLQAERVGFLWGLAQRIAEGALPVLIGLLL